MDKQINQIKTKHKKKLFPNCFIITKSKNEGDFYYSISPPFILINSLSVSLIAQLKQISIINQINNKNNNHNNLINNNNNNIINNNQNTNNNNNNINNKIYNNQNNNNDEENINENISVKKEILSGEISHFIEVPIKNFNPEFRFTLSEYGISDPLFIKISSDPFLVFIFHFHYSFIYFILFYFILIICSFIYFFNLFFIHFIYF